MLDRVDAAKSIGARDTPDEGVVETRFAPMVSVASADPDERLADTGPLLLQVTAIRAQLDRVLTRLTAIERRLEKRLS